MKKKGQKIEVKYSMGSSIAVSVNAILKSKLPHTDGGQHTKAEDPITEMSPDPGDYRKNC